MKVSTFQNKEHVAGMLQVELDTSAFLWANISQFFTADIFFILNLKIVPVFVNYSTNWNTIQSLVLTTVFH